MAAMTYDERLHLIRIRHRRIRRASGVPVYISKAERLAIDRAIDLGESEEEVARRHGLVLRQVSRVRVNRAFYAGLSPEPFKLNRRQRKALEGL